MKQEPRRTRTIAVAGTICCLLVGPVASSASAAPKQVDPRTVPVVSVPVPWTRVVAVDAASERLLSAGGSAAEARLRIAPLATLNPTVNIPLQITEGDVQELVIAGNLAYVCSEGRVTVVDLASNSILRRWRTVGARDFAVDPGRGVIYALSRSFVTSVAGEAPQWPAEYLIDAMDARTGAPLARWSIWRGQQAPAQVVPDTGDRLLLSGDGRSLYAGLYGIGQVVRVDTASGAAVGTAAVATPLEAIALDETRGRLLWLGNGQVGTLSLDLAALPDAATVERNASILVTDPQAGVVYVGSPRGAQVNVLALPGLGPITSLSVDEPSSIAAGPAGTFVLSAGVGDRTIVSRYSLDAGRAIPLQSAGPPQDVSTSISGTTVQVSWGPPANEQVSKPSRYRVVSVPDGRTCTTSGSACAVSGLRPGTRYRFQVQAGNQLGWGERATTSRVLVPKPTTRPSTPRPSASPTPKPSASLS